MLLDLDAEREDALDAPERPRHSIRRRVAAQRVADIAVGTDERECRGQEDEAWIDHRTSLPVTQVTYKAALTSALVDARTFLGMERTGRDDVVLRRHRAHHHAGQLSSSADADSPRRSSRSKKRARRPTIWATAQYLSYAPLGSTVTVKTDLAVVGGHVTQARATTYAEDREILTVNGAFGTGELTRRQPVGHDARRQAPEECPERVMPERFNRSIFNHLETRIAWVDRFERLTARRDRRSRRSGHGSPDTSISPPRRWLFSVTTSPVASPNRWASR